MKIRVQEHTAGDRQGNTDNVTGEVTIQEGNGVADFLRFARSTHGNFVIRDDQAFLDPARHQLR